MGSPVFISSFSLFSHFPFSVFSALQPFCPNFTADMDRLDTYESVDLNDKTVQILRGFFDHLPADGRINFLLHLELLHTNKQLRDHAESLMNGLVTPFSLLRPNPSISPRFGMDSIQNIASGSSGLMARKSCLKTECLARDGARCVVTGLLYEDSLDSNSSNPTTYTGCVHIIPFALAS